MTVVPPEGDLLDLRFLRITFSTDEIIWSNINTLSRKILSLLHNRVSFCQLALLAQLIPDYNHIYIKPDDLYEML